MYDLLCIQGFRCVPGCQVKHSAVTRSIVTAPSATMHPFSIKLGPHAPVNCKADGIIMCKFCKPSGVFDKTYWGLKDVSWSQSPV